MTENEFWTELADSIECYSCFFKVLCNAIEDDDNSKYDCEDILRKLWEEQVEHEEIKERFRRKHE